MDALAVYCSPACRQMAYRLRQKHQVKRQRCILCQVQNCGNPGCSRTTRSVHFWRLGSAERATGHRIDQVRVKVAVALARELDPFALMVCEPVAPASAAEMSPLQPNVPFGLAVVEQTGRTVGFERPVW